MVKIAMPWFQVADVSAARGRGAGTGPPTRPDGWSTPISEMITRATVSLTASSSRSAASRKGRKTSERRRCGRAGGPRRDVATRSDGQLAVTEEPGC